MRRKFLAGGLRSHDHRAVKVLSVIMLASVWLTVGFGGFSCMAEDPSVKVEPLAFWRAGASADLQILFLNESSSPLDLNVPMTVEIHQGESLDSVSFAQVGPSAPAGQPLGPSQFRKAVYRGTVPVKWGGALILKIKVGSQTVKAIVEIEPEVSQSAQPGWVARRFGVDWQEQRNPSSPVAEFLSNHFSSHEPVYFVAGADSPNIRFQISLRYRIVSAESELGRRLPLSTGLHVAYTQSSLWDLKGDSQPFLDSSYKPELQYSVERMLTNYLPSTVFFGVRMGLQHESNGKAGADSRGLNLVYIKPVLTLGNPEHFHFTFEPKIFAYITEMRDNPDLAFYRGSADLRVVVGWKDGLQFSALGRVGSHVNRGSILADVTYPLAVFNDGLGAYLDLQYFEGYGETLLHYNERSSALRFGLSLIR